MLLHQSGLSAVDTPLAITSTSAPFYRTATQQVSMQSRSDDSWVVSLLLPDLFIVSADGRTIGPAGTTLCVSGWTGIGLEPLSQAVIAACQEGGVYVVSLGSGNGTAFTLLLAQSRLIARGICAQYPNPHMAWDTDKLYLWCGVQELYATRAVIVTPLLGSPSCYTARFMQTLGQTQQLYISCTESGLQAVSLTDSSVRALVFPSSPDCAVVVDAVLYAGRLHVAWVDVGGSGLPGFSVYMAGGDSQPLPSATSDSKQAACYPYEFNSHVLQSSTASDGSLTLRDVTPADCFVQTALADERTGAVYVLCSPIPDSGGDTVTLRSQPSGATTWTTSS